MLTAGTVLFLLRQLFLKTQSSSESKVGNLEGAVGHIITPIPQNGVGEIAYVQAGSRYTAPARETDGAPVPTGAAVKIVRIVGSQFYVKTV
jgi:membrane-bound ClpP family serine protease